jgi:hypothetical protein
LNSKFQIALQVLNDGEAELQEAEDRAQAAKEAATKQSSDSEEEASKSKNHNDNVKADPEDGGGKQKEVESQSGDASNTNNENHVNNEKEAHSGDKSSSTNPDSWRVAEASKCNISDEASMINLIRSLPPPMQKYMTRQIPNETDEEDGEVQVAEGKTGEKTGDADAADSTADGATTATTTPTAAGGSEEGASSTSASSGSHAAQPSEEDAPEEDAERHAATKAMVLAIVGKQFQKEKKQRFLRQKILEFQVYQKRHFVFGKDGAFWGSGGRELRKVNVKEGDNGESKAKAETDANVIATVNANPNAVNIAGVTVTEDGVAATGDNKHPRQQFVWLYVFRKRGAAGTAARS